jgi:methylmalonyl-CoA mutase N-terminal domain/subunit
VDPLAGSYFVEALTSDMETSIRSVMDDLDRRGGMVECLRQGYVQRRIAERAFEWERKVETGETTIVGMNQFASTDRPQAVELQRVPAELESRQVERVRQVRAKRDETKVTQALDRLAAASRGTENLIPSTLEAVRAYATVGEITQVLKRTFGTYVPPTF